jgi:hypothetical protein
MNDEGSKRPSERFRWVLGLALPAAVAAMVAGWTLAGMAHPGWFSDSIDYLVIGDYFSAAWWGEPSEDQVAAFRTTRFPPLLPALLALVGSDIETSRYVPAFALTLGCWFGAQVMFLLWLRRVLLDPLAVGLIGMLVILCPGALAYLQIAPASEPLLLLIVMGALYLTERIDGLGRDSLLLLALIVSVAPLARTVGIALVVPFVAVLLLRPDLGGQRWRAIALAASPTVCWMLYRTLSPGAENYTDALTQDQFRFVFGSLERYLAEQPVRLWEGWLALLAPFGGTAGRIASGLVLVLAVFGLLIRLRDRKLDAGYVSISLCIIAIWPYPAEIARLLTVVLPVMCAHAAIAPTWLYGKLRRGADPVSSPAAPGLRLVMPALLVIACAGSIGVVVQRAVVDVASELRPFKHMPTYFLAGNDTLAVQTLETNARLLATIGALRPVVPPGDCVYSVMPALVRLHAKVDTLPFPLDVASSDDARQRLQACRFFLVTWTTTMQFGQPPLYPSEHLKSWTVPIMVSTMPVEGRDVPIAVLLQAR